MEHFSEDFPGAALGLWEDGSGWLWVDPDPALNLLSALSGDVSCGVSWRDLLCTIHSFRVLCEERPFFPLSLGPCLSFLLMLYAGGHLKGHSKTPMFRRGHAPIGQQPWTDELLPSFVRYMK